MLTKSPQQSYYLLKNINLIIAGVQKAGTSSLYDWMSQHPEIHGPIDGKDFHFFSREEFYNKGYEFLHTRYEDRKHYPIVMHAGVNYMLYENALLRIKQYNADAKLIIVLRNPIDRAVSAFNFMKQLGIEQGTFSRALAKEQAGKLTSPIEINNLSYLEHGLYAKQLHNIYKYFPAKQVKILIYEDFINSKTIFIKEIFEWLSISSKFVPSYTRINTTGIPKYKWINRFLYKDNTAKKLIKKVLFLDKVIGRKGLFVLRRKIRESNIEEKQKHIKITPTQNEIELMQSFFYDDLKRLGELLNIDFFEKWNFPKTVSQ